MNRSVSLTLTADDYVAANRLHFLQHLRTRWRAIVAFTIWFAAYLIWMWVAYNDGWNATAMIATSACFVAFPLILMVAKYFLFIPISTRRTFQKQKTLHQPCIYSWSEAGLTLANESGEWRVAWSDYLKWREDGRIFMFYQAPRLFNMVPKRALTPEQVTDLRQCAELIVE